MGCAFSGGSERIFSFGPVQDIGRVICVYERGLDSTGDSFGLHGQTSII